MNTEETGKILAYITAVEPTRDFGEFEFKVWHDLLKDLQYEDALEGTRAYFKAANTYPIKPGNIIAGTRIARTHRIRRQNDVARKRIVELGGETPTYWSGEPYNSNELARIGALIEAHDPNADHKVRQYITDQQKHRQAIEAGNQWAKEHHAELGITIKTVELT